MAKMLDAGFDHPPLVSFEFLVVLSFEFPTTLHRNETFGQPVW
jgi:hypothetical protein